MTIGQYRALTAAVTLVVGAALALRGVVRDLQNGPLNRTGG